MPEIFIELTTNELEYATFFGHRKHDKSERDGRKADWYDGTERGNHADGVAGEMAGAKLLDVYWQPRIDTFKGADIGENIEVRTTKSDWFGVKVKSTDEDERIVIALYKVNDSKYQVLGWIKAGDAKKQIWLRDPGNRKRPAYFVPREALNSINTLPRPKMVRRYQVQ